MSSVNYFSLYREQLWLASFVCQSKICSGTATLCVYSHYLSTRFIKLAQIFTPSHSTTAGDAKSITRATHCHCRRAYLEHWSEYNYSSNILLGTYYKCSMFCVICWQQVFALIKLCQLASTAQKFQTCQRGRIFIDFQLAECNRRFCDTVASRQNVRKVTNVCHVAQEDSSL